MNSPTAEHVSTERWMALTFALDPHALHECNTDQSDLPTDIKRFVIGGIPKCETGRMLLCAHAHLHKCAFIAFQPRAMGISTSVLIPQYFICPNLKSTVLWGSPVLNTSPTPTQLHSDVRTVLYMHHPTQALAIF